MEQTPAQKAIELALRGLWEEAIKVNSEILLITPDDTEAMNRLARCYSELGKVGKAREIAQKVLEIDPLNTIAEKCLEKWSGVKSSAKHNISIASAEAFLEESGKTKIAPLMHLGDSKIFASLDPGDEVILQAHAHRVSVETADGKYLGRLHDDLAARLRNLLKSGNKYQVLIKTIDPPKEVTVFMREIERGKEAGSSPSFPAEKIEYVAFTSPELVHKDKATMEFQEEVMEEG